MLKGKKITLLVTGSIAAYKSAEIVREFIKRGAIVRVAMSESATQFVTPLTLQTLSHNIVSTKLLDVTTESQISHIELADQPDLVLVAPATANIIAKAAHGIADDIVSAVILATKAKTVFAPAMNINMWENPITQKNVSLLKEYGKYFIEPGEGELACGWYGPGRLAEPSTIIESVESLLATKDLQKDLPNDLAGNYVIVTAGPTREPIDPVRFISNKSSGKMGHALAKVCRNRGAKVSLIAGSNGTTPFASDNFKVVKINTAQELQESLRQEINYAQSLTGVENIFLFMAAAVCDHRPKEISSTKLKHDKSKDVELTMTPNPDLLAEVGKQLSGEPKFKIIGFAVETGDEKQLIEYAKNKLVTKKADLIVANLGDEAFDRDTNQVWLIDKANKVEKIERADKETIADIIVSRALALR